MATNFTRQHKRKNKKSPRATEDASPLIEPSKAEVAATPPAQISAAFPTASGVDVSWRAWLIASLVIIAIAGVLRFSALELKPMHHDEGVNGFFLMNLAHNGDYKYDPSNYHGPTLYYFTLPSVVLFGLSTFSLRLVTALFGIATVGLMLYLRRYIGAVGALTAAALVAVSPGAVYYSRYFIHEELFIFFTLAAVVAALRFYETRKPLFVMLAIASAALLFATKETAFVSIGTLGLAWLVARWWVPATNRSGVMIGGQRVASRARQPEPRGTGPRWWELFGDRNRAQRLFAGGLALFVLLNVLFYSSFFTNWAGVGGALEALKVWSKTGASEFHAKPFGTYLGWLIQEEAPIFFLAVIGALIALFELRKNRFAVFASAWAFGILVAYSLIPYKTPWLMLSFVVPMAIAAGYAAQHLAGRWTYGRKIPSAGLLVAGLAVTVCAYQCLVLNFRQYDNDAYPYVYTHTNRETLALIEKVERLAERDGNNKMAVTITSPEYWPLPWYFRNNPSVGYVGTVAEHYDPKAMPVVIGKESRDAKEDQAGKLRTTLAADYQEVGVYTLRPGVRLALFARRDLLAAAPVSSLSEVATVR